MESLVEIEESLDLVNHGSVAFEAANVIKKKALQSLSKVANNIASNVKRSSSEETFYQPGPGDFLENGNY